MDNISEHISYKEAVYSDTALRNGYMNKPDDYEISNMVKLAENIFEPLRNHFRKPIYISSMFRSYELNVKIGGSESSQHMKGEAMDIDADVYGDVTNVEIFKYIRGNLDFDQVIFESPKGDGDCEWVHVSYCDYNRNQVLIMEDGKYKII